MIHYDADHNLHCMITGRKDFMMMKNTEQNRKFLYFFKKVSAYCDKLIVIKHTVTSSRFIYYL